TNDRAAANVTKAGVQVCVFPRENALREGRRERHSGVRKSYAGPNPDVQLNLVAAGAALALLLENTGARPFGLAVERGRRVDDGSKTTSARWVGRRRAADFIDRSAVDTSRQVQAE